MDRRLSTILYILYMACDVCVTYYFVKPFFCVVMIMLISLKQIDSCMTLLYKQQLYIYRCVSAIDMCSAAH
jgi:hypothetical protein